MLRRASLTRHSPTHARRSLRLALEALEGRAVLSVCGVSCDYFDGTLNVQGTAGDDLIDLRYDADRSMLSVIGASDELVAEFPLSAIRQLNVHGLEGNDVFSVDSSLKVPIILNGGEGEDALLANTAAGHVHSHAAASPFLQSSIERILAAVPQSPASSLTTSFGPSAPTTAATTSEALEDSDSTNSFGSDASSLTTYSLSSTSGSTYSAVPLLSLGAVLQSAIHAAHGDSPDAAVLPILASHAHDAGHTSSATTPLAAPGHSHTPLTTVVQHQASAADATDNSEFVSSNHDEHESGKTASEPASKLVPKPCTVSRTGGLVVTAVDGKRQCNCPEKELAAQEATQQIFSEGPLSVTRSLFGKGDDCIPCQSLALFAGPGGTPLSDLLPNIPGARNLMLEHLTGEACPDKESLAAAEQAADDATWLSGLPLVGYSLLATSAVLLPTLVPRKKSEEKRESAVPAVDWLFGRLNVELLLAR